MKLKEEIQKIKYDNESILNNLNDMKKENSVLTTEVNNDIGSIKQFQELGLLNNNQPNENLLKIDPKTNQIIRNNYSIKKDVKNFYDVIVNIKSVKDIEYGWEIKMTERGEKNYLKYRNDKLLRIWVIGNSNKGKSFILSKISKITLPSGTSIRTEGLSIKYPELEKFINRKIVLLDSAGLETPVLREDNHFINIENKNEKQNEDYNEEEKTNEDELIDNNNIDNKTNETKNKELFKEKSREKLITELFLQSYIITFSDILILVVGILTYSEQKLLNRIKTEMQKKKIKKPLFIIHNLKTYFSKEQVEEYIENFLLKSATFVLEKGHKISSELKQNNGIYYFEVNSEPKIFHLIYANEGSEAGDFYNNYTLYFIEHSFQNVTDLKEYNFIKTIKNKFVELSKEIIERKDEKQDRLTLDDFKTDDEIITNKKIELKTPQKIILKRCMIDELGFSNLKTNGFEPNYNYFKKENENKIILRIEVPGNNTIKSSIDYIGEYTIIRISGKKKQDKEPKNLSENLHNTREFGDFNLDIPLKTEEFIIKNSTPKICDKKGVIMIEYEYDQKKEVTTYGEDKNNEEDDI